MRILQSKEKDR